ncbi:hypothetical protein RRG08_064931 [Elysia crispata]|uniref:Uncharacterized protein n=1 Tax=Elysia crispata TaxID=231223 RepID=A0AAE0XN97_9GAST|nr:hypothetical protein RRG08_064931 [Elysia crispata]
MTLGKESLKLRNTLRIFALDELKETEGPNSNNCVSNPHVTLTNGTKILLFASICWRSFLCSKGKISASSPRSLGDFLVRCFTSLQGNTSDTVLCGRGVE